MVSDDYFNQEPMLDLFIFETLQLLEQLEELLIEVEKNNSEINGSVNEIFRIMHTIKGSSAMMMFSGISKLAHSLEDLFSYIRDKKDIKLDRARLTDIVLKSVDFIKGEIAKIQNGNSQETFAEGLIEEINEYLKSLIGDLGALQVEDSNIKSVEKKRNRFYISRDKSYENLNKFRTKLFFQYGSQMENIRAYTVVRNLEEVTNEIFYEPQDILENDKTSEIISENGFTIYFSTKESESDIRLLLEQTIFLEKLELEKIDAIPEIFNQRKVAEKEELFAKSDDYSEQSESLVTDSNTKQSSIKQQNIISVNLNKLDMLMDIVGEIVISEAMVTRNPELDGLVLENFNKSARQLRKLTSELQDIVMSIRMIPISGVFNKMQRIVRDMNRKLGKDVDLLLSGEETEVDKNIIDHLSDPLMHLIRNALDHGIESSEERLKNNKPEKGTIRLEALNSGGDVIINIKDDGKGLDREKILRKAKEQGLLLKPEDEYLDKELYNFILLPGFSTKENVSEFSGRGVGMDVVRDNIEKVGGTIIIDSVSGRGTSISIKIPLTLAIIDGMLIKVGTATYIIPTTSIRESFRAELHQIIKDTDNNEMIMLRGECYSLIRIHRVFSKQTNITNLEEGIIVVVEVDSQTICLFADELIGEQQAVVKPIPSYIKKSKGLAGCTILGDGSISLIIDTKGIIEQ
jgi:two-component system chemotaxis sensor kinase CheA